jgi:hypothetical protein
MTKKENVTKGTKTALEAAQELIESNNKKDIDGCVKELQEHQKIENQILEKYGCVKTVFGQFQNDKIHVQFNINKKP